MPTPGAPRYPHLRIATTSANPLVLIAAIRLALRQAGIAPGEIERFSSSALSQGTPKEQREVCRQWVRLPPG
ncbi:MAG: hypothetical protein AAGD01_16210 [Acidobacteriota bacterium]